MTLALQILISLGMKLLTAAAIEDLLVFVCVKVAAHTETKADDELVQLVKKHLGKV